MLRSILIATTILATLLVAIPAAVRMQWLACALAAGIGPIWLAAQRRHVLFAPYGLGSLTLLAAGEMIFGGSAPMLMAGVVAVLCAYELDCFAFRLRSIDVVRRAAIERAHLRRLLPVATIALALGELAVVLRLTLSFGWLVVLAVLGVLVLGRVVRFLRKIG
jgi:hypothetical protein